MIYQSRINTGCITCIITGLEYLESYYLKEINNYPKSEPVLEPVSVATENVTVLDKKSPCKKCGKKK
jgi:hypothetical protein